jgi:hypothetical protein
MAGICRGGTRIVPCHTVGRCCGFAGDFGSSAAGAGIVTVALNSVSAVPLGISQVCA